jgi:hypothetical protein
VQWLPVLAVCDFILSYCCLFILQFLGALAGGSFAKLGSNVGLCGFAIVPPNALVIVS